MSTTVYSSSDSSSGSMYESENVLFYLIIVVFVLFYNVFKEKIFTNEKENGWEAPSKPGKSIKEKNKKLCLIGQIKIGMLLGLDRTSIEWINQIFILYHKTPKDIKIENGIEKLTKFFFLKLY